MASNYYARQNPKLFPQGIYEESSTQKLPLGTIWPLADGRAFIYCKNAAAGSVAIGKWVQSSALTATSVGLAIASGAAIGDDHVHVTNGAGTATANLFKEGYLSVDSGLGVGQCLKIASHAALTSGGEGIIYLSDYIRVALTVAGSSVVSLIPHVCSDVIIGPTSMTGVCVGVAPITPTASYYFWSQIKGQCAVLVDTGETLVIGDGVSVPGGSDAGAVDVAAAGEIDQRIGIAYYVASATAYAQIVLNGCGLM